MSISTVSGLRPLSRFRLQAAFVTVLMAFLFLVPGCGNEPPPTEPEPEAASLAADEIPIDAHVNARRLLSRSVAAGTDRVTVLDASGPDHDRTYSFEVIDPSLPDIRPGTILLGEGFGAAQEVTHARRNGGVVIVRTREIDYSPVSKAGQIDFHVPLDGDGGQNDVVRWGPWELVNPNNGQRIPFEDGSLQSDFPLDQFFDGFGVCVEGGPVTACGKFEVTVLEGYLKAAGGVDFGVVSTYPEETFVDASITVWEEIDAKLILEIDGDAFIEIEKCVFGFCGDVDEPQLVRKFEAGNIAGEIVLGIVVGVRGEIRDVIFRPGFELNDLDMSFTVGFDDEPTFAFTPPDAVVFEPFFEVVSLGEGALRIYVGPKLSASVEVLGGWAEVGAEIGAYAYIEQTVGLDPLIAECPLWNTGTTAGTEVAAKAYGKLGSESLAGFWVIPGPSARLFDWWSTGDLTVQTTTSGVDPDYNGYDVTSVRNDTENPPEWDDVFSTHLGLNDQVMWDGGSFCHEFPEWLPFIGGIQDCDLVSTHHDVGISDVMWNCAVTAADDAVVCVEPFTTTTHTFDVTCISVFQALCMTVDDYLQAGMIKNFGLARSLKAKLQNAEAARDRGQPHVAENVLRAATHELVAQRDKGMHPDVTDVLSERIQTVVAHYLYPNAIDETLLTDDTGTVDPGR